MLTVRNSGRWNPAALCPPRPAVSTDPESAATQMSLRSTADRVRQLTDECKELETAMKPLGQLMTPRLLEEVGVGVLVAAQILVS